MFYVYNLFSTKDKRTYTGYTQDLAARLKQHNEGRVTATKHRIPLKLIYAEQFQTLGEAKEREKWWKSSTGRRHLKQFFLDL